ncbi:hypothetical protein MRB53_040646 [Persea americana]|nr:hypothetical protein MRB53_040646 [Persea americana]
MRRIIAFSTKGRRKCILHIANCGDCLNVIEYQQSDSAAERGKNAIVFYSCSIPFRSSHKASIRLSKNCCNSVLHLPCSTTSSFRQMSQQIRNRLGLTKRCRRVSKSDCDVPHRQLSIIASRTIFGSATRPPLLWNLTFFWLLGLL